MKFRIDFVTNSSSSSFVAYGIYDEELAKKIKSLLRTHAPYPESTLGCISVSGGVISVTRELSDVDGWGDYKIFEKLEDDYDGRTKKQKEADEKEALNADNVIEALSGFFDNSFPGEEEKRLISAAVREGGVKCEVYVDQTDGYDARDFSYDERELSANRTAYRVEAEAKKAKRESGVVTTHEFNDIIKFRLASNFTLERETDDEGDETVKIFGSEYEDDEGESHYAFSSILELSEYESSDFEEEVTTNNLLDRVADKVEDALRISVSSNVCFIAKAMPVSLFGRTIKSFGMVALIKTSEMSVLRIISSGTYRDDDRDKNLKLCEDFYTVLQAVRVSGKRLNLGNTTPAEMLDLVEQSLGEDNESIDLSSGIKINISVGGQTTTYQYTDGGIKAVEVESLKRVDPNEELFPHYASIKNAGGLGFLGANIIVNASGTEYSFEPLSRVVDSYRDKEMQEVFRRIIAKDVAYYDLHEKAKEMQKLFHVSEEAFDPHHDRECELEEGLMHRAYMMSGLRSFAWTLADYCKNHDDCKPEDIDSGVAKRIANFVAQQDWLNYDGDTYCQGLCAGSDLHVYFIPDSVSQADRKKLLPSHDDLERVKEMKAKFSSYREILCEVHSLDDLREDLEYIYPAVKMLWNDLEEDRDYDEALTGNEADIVYAWCALALAAKAPFFTEDGPTSCFFDQLDGDGTTIYRNSFDDRNMTEAWMEKYGEYVESNPHINFNGKLFVFSGFGHASEKEHPIVKKVIEKGGQYRSKVSGLTNYLVVDPSDAGSSKINSVIEQLQKGKQITVVLLEDLESALEGNGADRESKSQSATGRKVRNSVKKKVAQPTIDNNINYAKLTMDDVVVSNGELLSYKGTEKNVIFPNGITEIGYEFSSGAHFENIVIPEGVTTIRDRAFSYQYGLRSVVLPSTLEIIGEEAFSACYLLERVDFPEGLTTIEKSAFETCDSLKMIVIPDTVQAIGDSAFYGCGNLKDIFLQGEVDNLPKDAFFGVCSNFVLHIPPHGDVESYCKKNYLKYDYDSVENYKPAEPKPLAEKSSPSDFVIDGNGLLDSYNGYAKIVEIPDTANEIYYHVFAHRHEIEKVIIPEGLQKIGGGAFSCCLSLSEVILPTTLRIVEGVAFSECISLEKISFAPGLETLKGSLFHENIKDIYLPASVKEIEDYAIYASDRLTVHVPAGSIAEKYAKKRNIKFDNESDPMMTKYLEEAEDRARQKEEEKRKAREEAERKTREEAERKAREEAERKAREEAERKAREEAERKAREEAEKAQKAFIASETATIEKEYAALIDSLSQEYQDKETALMDQINDKKLELDSLEKQYTSASFFAFMKKSRLNNAIHDARIQIKKMESEKFGLAENYKKSLAEAQTKRDNRISVLPMRAGKKYPMPKK